MLGPIFPTSTGGGGGSGTVTSVSVVTANGVSGSVATATTTPAITLTLGAITPTTVNGLTITPTNGTLTVANGSSIITSGANQITLTSTGSTNVTLPTSGTLLTTTGSGSGLSGIVTSITGTANQVIASGATGAVTLSLPQSIATSSTPQFAKVGIGAAADATRLLLVQGDVTGGVVTFDRVNVATNSVLGTMNLKTTSTGDMTDGFGGSFQFIIQDTAAVENIIASVHGIRDGADNSGSLRFQTRSAGVSNTVGMWDHTGQFSLTPVIQTTGSPTAFLLTGAANTTLTASTESTDVNFDLSRTVQFATGALTTQRAFRIQGPVYAAVGASTITTAVTLDITTPTNGTNVTITNARSIRANGVAEFSGSVSSAIILSGGVGSVAGIAVTAATTVLSLKGNLAAATSTFDVLVNSSVARTAGGMLSVQNNGTAKFTVGFQGRLDILPAAVSGGVQTVFNVTNANNTLSTASNEVFNFRWSALTRQWNTGALTTQREWWLNQCTYAAAGASTITTAAMFTIEGAPLAGTNVTITNSYAIWVQAGVCRFESKLSFDSTLTAAGTTGAQTINKPSGSVNFAAAATTLVVTNSLVTTSSLVFVTQNTNDATATVKDVEIASGSFTIRLAAAATAETKVSFLVIN